MSEEEIVDLVNMASILGIKEIVASGGEPFIRPDLLASLSHLCLNHNLGLHAITSANWAVDKQKALDMLRMTGPWSRLAVSCDDFHQTKIPIEYCINVLYAAKDLGINTCVATIDNADSVLRKIPSDLMDGISVISQPLISTHHQSWKELSKPCVNMAVPYCENGKYIYACCGDLCDLEIDSPVYLGTVKGIQANGLAIEKLQLIRFLRLFGPLGLYSAVNAGSIDKSLKFTSHCKLCTSIFDKPHSREKLANFLQNEGVIARIAIAEAVLFSNTY
jgi:organic radical activating enzyme